MRNDNAEAGHLKGEFAREMPAEIVFYLGLGSQEVDGTGDMGPQHDICLGKVRIHEPL